MLGLAQMAHIPRDSHRRRQRPIMLDAHHRAALLSTEHPQRLTDLYLQRLTSHPRRHLNDGPARLDNPTRGIQHRLLHHAKTSRLWILRDCLRLRRLWSGRGRRASLCRLWVRSGRIRVIAGVRGTSGRGDRERNRHGEHRPQHAHHSPATPL